MPNPNGMAHALLMSRYLDTQSPSIGRDPRKNVAPGLVPVCSLIALHRLGPSVSVSSFSQVPIDCVLVVVHEKHYSVPVRAPLPDELDKMFAEQDQGACQILPLHNKILALLLVCGSRIDIFVFAWIIGCDDPRVVSICTA
jgi:hypothetical protein